MLTCYAFGIRISLGGYALEYVNDVLLLPFLLHSCYRFCCTLVAIFAAVLFPILLHFSIPVTKGARTICSAVTTMLHRGQPWSTPCLPPARHTALMNGRGLRMSCAGSRNTNRQGKTTQTFFPETGAHCLQSNSNQYHTPIKRLQPASH